MRNTLRLAVLVCLAIFSASPTRAADQPPAANPSPDKKLLNVLFCIADDASAHFGAYGCTWTKTPHIDSLAKSGLVFTNAFTPTAKCAPSRASILTGRNPWQLEEAANHQSHFPAKFKAFTESLSDAGVYVGSHGKFWGPGDAKTADGKPRTWGMSGKGGMKAANNKGGDDNGAAFRSFLDARPQGKPFFYWFGSKNPHRPYKLDSGIAAGKQPGDIEHVPAYWPDNDTVRRDMLDYAIEIEAYDREVGSLLKVLEETGEAKNTLVIVTSDHGMPFPRVKGHNYQLSNHVPLVARVPQGAAQSGQKVADFISFADLAPTMLEWFGVSHNASGMSPITGHSFCDLLRGKSQRERSFAILGRERNDVWARPGTEAGLGYPVRGLREGNFLYLHNFAADRWPCGNVELGLLDTDGSPTKSLIHDLSQGNRFWEFCFGKRPAVELFDVASDPDCVKNLAADMSYRDTVTKMHDKLVAELKRQSDPRVLGQGDLFDNYPTAKKGK